MGTPELSQDIMDLRDLVDYLDESDEDGGDVARAVEEGMIADLALPGRDGFIEHAEDEPTAIHVDYFEEYARELAEDIGAVQADADWPLRHIDWAAAAEELKADYSEFDVTDPETGGIETYLVRAY